MHRGILVAFCTLVAVVTAYRQAKRQNSRCCLPDAFTGIATNNDYISRMLNTAQPDYQTKIINQFLVKDGIKFYKSVTKDDYTVVKLDHFTKPMATEWTLNNVEKCYRQDRFDLDASSPDAKGEFCFEGSLSGREVVDGRAYDIYEFKTGDPAQSTSYTRKIYAEKDDAGNCIPVYEERNAVIGVSDTVVSKVNYTIRAISDSEANLLVPPSRICAKRKRNFW
jgi:hypothetical protein